MVKELQAATAYPDVTAYFQLFDATGQVRDVVAPEWEAYATANIGDYDIAATEAGTSSAIYTADMPASVSAGVYSYLLRQRVGGSPAEVDPVIAGPGLIEWDGSARVSLYSRLAPTVAGRTLDVSAGGEGGVDWANVGTAGSTVNLSATTVNLVNTLTTYTGNTVQTGDSFARLGAPAGASVSADILAVDNLVDDLESRLGTPSNFGSGATVAANLVDIEGQTDDIGAAGAGLTAVPWNAAWDAEVQSEAEDALVVHRLDELLNADSDIDGAAPPTVGSVFHELMTKTAGSFTFDQTTDSLEALRDRGDAAWITATGFSTHSAADVWAAGTRTLTALGFTLAASDLAADTLTAAKVAADVGTEIGTAVWATAARTLTAATNITSTGGTTVPQTGDSYARLGAPAGASVSADIAAVQADLPQRVTKNAALSGFTFPLFSSSDHHTPTTGLTVTATRSLDGAAFAACANSVSELSNGLYKIDLAAADLNGNVVCLKFTATGADAQLITLVTQPT
jgi:hypothetical protein